ncbi:MAG: hypothetical protein J6Z82_00655 [Schwartzia sp.]|nr:hypothetical protein [Schwartzia sp. (in: firmicutes)]
MQIHVFFRVQQDNLLCGLLILFHYVAGIREIAHQRGFVEKIQQCVLFASYHPKTGGIRFYGFRVAFEICPVDAIMKFYVPQFVDFRQASLADVRGIFVLVLYAEAMQERAKSGGGISCQRIILLFFQEKQNFFAKRFQCMDYVSHGSPEVRLDMKSFCKLVLQSLYFFVVYIIIHYIEKQIGNLFAVAVRKIIFGFT